MKILGTSTYLEFSVLVYPFSHALQRRLDLTSLSIPHRSNSRSDVDTAQSVMELRYFEDKQRCARRQYECSPEQPNPRNLDFSYVTHPFTVLGINAGSKIPNHKY